MAEILKVIDDQLEYEPYETEFLSRNMDEFFSFYGFYQDMINELQDNCDYEDDKEVSVLRAARVID